MSGLSSSGFIYCYVVLLQDRCDLYSMFVEAWIMSARLYTDSVRTPTDVGTRNVVTATIIVVLVVDYECRQS